MKRRLATRGGILLPAFLLALMLQAGCGGDAEVTIVDENDAPDVAGVLLLPDGDGGTSPTADTQVFVSRITSAEVEDGFDVGPVIIGDQLTDDAGRYQVSLGSDIIDDCEGGRVLNYSEQGGLTRALAFSDEEDININYASEAMVRLIFDEAVREDGADFCAASNDDLRNLLAVITTATDGVTGNTVSVINNNAYALAASSPAVQAALASAFDIVEPTRTSTATGTPTGGATSTPTATGVVTATNTPTATLTHTAVITNTPTATPATPANTPTNTVEPTSTPTGEATATPTDVPPTSTPTDVVIPPTSTPTDVVIPPTSTPTAIPDTPTSIPTETSTAPPTPTNTVDPGLPNVAIGSASGEAGAQVVIPFTLTKNGKSINVIAPLTFTFDDTRLTYAEGGCVSAVSGKNPTIQVTGNSIGIALSGTEAVFPDGVFLNCTFTIKAEATGVAPITFVSAGMADQDFNDYNATGSSGQVTIGGGPAPTSTPTVVVSTPTTVPNTPTTVPNTPTTVPNTPTEVPSTPTEVPSTPTTVPNTPTTVPNTPTTVPSTPTTVPNTPTTVPNTPTTVPNTPTNTVAANTPTPTTGGGNVPNVAIGSASGAAGAQVVIPFTLTKNGPTINVIAPLTFTFDDSRLTYPDGGCASAVAGKNPTIQVTGNSIGIALSGTEAAFPDGVFLNCTFNIKAEATGVAPITFVSAGMADQDFNDYNATGSNGQVTVSGGGAPTNTPTVAAATPTATISLPTDVPVVQIGNVGGAAGANVVVPFSLTKNGPTINVIAPLTFTFDDTRLTYTEGGCASAVSGKNPTIQVTGSSIGVALSGTEAAFPDGVFLNCTFGIKAGATGTAPVTFVSAGMADQDFNDYNAFGVSGSVTVQ